MKVKRVPPWSAKGRTVPRPRVKNHPQGHEPEGLTVRRVPPWSAKGGAVAPVVRLKNHPK